MCSSAPNPPPPPNYAAAAEATATGNREAAIAAQRGSMVDQYTPYGSQTYKENGFDSFGNPIFRSDINLTPAGQQMVNQSDALSLGLFGAQNQQLGAVNNRGPINNSNVPGLQNSSMGSDVAYKAATQRLDPQWQASTESQENKLVNQGLRPGMEGYDNAMRDFNNAKNDAYAQARGAAESTGINQATLNNNASNQQLQQNQTMYEQPLNELNALRTGSQVNIPQFAAQPQQQYAGGANMLGAAQAQGGYEQGIYGAQVGAANSQNAGLYGLAGSGLMAGGMMFF